MSRNCRWIVKWILALIVVVGIPQGVSFADTPTPPPATVSSNRCSGWLFPYGNWNISPGTTIDSQGYVHSAGVDPIVATLTIADTVSLYSIAVNFNSGVVIFNDFATLSFDTFIQNSNSDSQVVEHGDAINNLNLDETATVYFSKPANTIKITLSKIRPTVGMYMKVTAICLTNGGPNPPIPNIPSATPTLPPSNTPGGATSTNTSVWTSTNTPTRTNTPRATATTGGASATAGPSSTSAGSATATPEGGEGPAPINGGSFSTIPPPPQCGDALNPCGSNPFMPNGVAPYDTPSGFATFVPITPVPGQPTSTLIIGPYCPTVSSGPTNTPCPTQTPNPSQTLSSVEGSVNDYATSMYVNAQQILTTPGFVGPDGSTLADVSNSGNVIGSYVGDFFGLVRAVQSFFLGKTGTIISILILIVAFTLVIDFLLFVIPVLLTLFKIFLQVLQVLTGLIP